MAPPSTRYTPLAVTATATNRFHLLCIVYYEITRHTVVALQKPFGSMADISFVTQAVPTESFVTRVLTEYFNE